MGENEDTPASQTVGPVLGLEAQHVNAVMQLKGEFWHEIYLTMRFTRSNRRAGSYLLPAETFLRRSIRLRFDATPDRARLV